MAVLFRNVLTASFHGSIVILAIILLRGLLKTIPKKYMCILWLLALIRLLLPFELQSGLSLQPDTPSVLAWTASEAAPGGNTGVTDTPQNDLAADPVEDSQNMQTPLPAVTEGVDLREEQEITPNPHTAAKAEFGIPELSSLASCIWLAVTCCFGVYTLISYLRLKRIVRGAKQIGRVVWVSHSIETAFILGFIHPRIYVPVNMSRENRKHILAHEQTHLEKGDHWIKLIGFLGLSLHWFNPLVWVAYVLLCKDIEMACDERVVQFMELEERKEYSMALLACSTNQAHFAACPVAFGEVSVKTRILSVLNYRKPSFWISLLGVLAVAFVALCLVTNPMGAEEPAGTKPEATETVDIEGVFTVETVDDFIAAIGSNREIYIKEGVYELSAASTYGKETGNAFCQWEEVYGGYTLSLHGVVNLTIRGSGMEETYLETAPGSADILYLDNCANVVLEDFTAGHIPRVTGCEAGVLYLKNSTGVKMNRLGLFGCGTDGVTAFDCYDVSIKNCEIYDCSISAFTMLRTDSAVISECKIYGIGTEFDPAYKLVDILECEGVVVEKCEFSGNKARILVQCENSSVELRDNHFTYNQIIDAAFDITARGVTLAGNTFADSNQIYIWYSDSGVPAEDVNGRPITEEELRRQGEDPIDPAETQPPTNS